MAKKKRAKQRSQDRFADLEHYLKLAMTLAGERPGRYGGRYVAWLENSALKPHCGAWVILDDDDPDKYRHIVILDIVAYVTPYRCYGVGRARHWITEDGTVDLSDDT